jgi:hypothetical protein
MKKRLLLGTIFRLEGISGPPGRCDPRRGTVACPDAGGLDHGAKGVDYESDKEAVNRLDTAPDCAVFVTSCTPSKPEDLPLYLSKAVSA